MEVIIDEKEIDEALSRSIAQVLPSKEMFKKALMKGEQLRMYIGADPTGADLHIGHATNFLLLEKFRQLGHEVIVLFGDFTARIGDPTDKDAARKRLSAEEIEGNIKTWKLQVEKVLDFSDKKNPATIHKNSEWLGAMTLADVVDLASHTTVQQMLERDMFERRLQSGRPIYVHEFLYPLMQGYDNVEMDIDVEVGGTDQTFNMLVGRDLVRAYKEREKFVVTTPLLEDPRTGKKLMSKSEGGYIALSDTPEDMYGKAMALPDETIIPVVLHTTRMPLPDVEALEKELKSGANPRDVKMRMARELVATYNSAEDARRAEEQFVETFQDKKIPSDVIEVKTARGTPLADVLLDNGIIASKAAFRRLVESRAVTFLERDERISDTSRTLTESGTWKVGKKRFIRIRVA